jgi:hypothetical protein
MENALNLLPYDRHIMHTHLSPEEVRARLEANVEPHKLMRPFELGKAYQGEITGYRFTIMKVHHMRNSPGPIISGEIARDESGSVISLNMRASDIVFIVVPVVILISLAVVALKIVQMVSFFRGVTEFPSIVELIGVLSFAIFVTAFGLIDYKNEVASVRQFFDKLFESIPE